MASGSQDTALKKEQVLQKKVEQPWKLRRKDSPRQVVEISMQGDGALGWSPGRGGPLRGLGSSVSVMEGTHPALL